MTIDPRGMSRLRQHSRSPTGLLYQKPFVEPPFVPNGADSPWWHSAWADIGVLLSTNERALAPFTEYGDWSNGLVAGFGFRAENRENADFVTGRAGSIGRDDQHYELRFGRYGLVSAGVFFDATPHLLATNARILWNGAGTANLTLPDALVPGATTAAQARAALEDKRPSRLTHGRTKTGINANYTPFDSWELFFALTSEWRDGRQALGSAFSFPARGAAELVQPIDYEVIDVNGGARFKGETVQANLTFASSFFRNSTQALTWENPGLGAPASAAFLARGRMALAPDNDYHAVRLDLAWNASDLRFVANTSYSLMLQNDPLLPPVVNAAASPINLGNWNSIAALSQPSADARLEIVDGYAQLSMTPGRQLRMSLEGRYRDETNSTRYLSFNPLTQQYGYVGLDGGLSRIYDPAVVGSDVPIRNIPFATDRFELTAKADYRILAKTRLNLALTHRETDRTHREVSHSNDNVLETQLSTVGHSWGTVRLTYELAGRSGDEYLPDPYEFARSVSLPGYIPRAGGDPPYALRQMEKYDIADRTEHRLKAQTNFLVRENADLQLGGSYRNADYAGEYGLRGAESYDLNASMSLQFSGSGSLTGFYSYQANNRDIASINVVRGPSSDDSAGGPNYPLANRWSETVDEKNHVAGANLHVPIGAVTADLSYTFTHASGEFAYAYASAGAISATLTAAQAGSVFPEQIYEHHLFEASLIWPYSEKILVRGYYRLEHEQLEDFRLTGLTNVVGNHLFLGVVPEPYTAHAVGLFTQYRF
jgi:MtrB/PioB family decaheme-associated outer membrane protein